MKRIIFLLCALITCVTNINAAETVVRITEPLSFMVTSDYRILNAKDNLDYFIIQCPGYTAMQLKEKFLVALNDLCHMSGYYGTKLHPTSVYSGEAWIKFKLWKVPFYTASYNLKTVPLAGNKYVQDVQHRFGFSGEITIEFRDGRIKVKTPQSPSISTSLSGISYGWQDYFSCKERPIHYAVNNTKLFNQRYADIIKTISDMYMELFDAVNDRGKTLEYKDSEPKTIKISADNYIFFHITPDGEITNPISQHPYIDVAIPGNNMTKKDCIEALNELYHEFSRDRTIGNEDEYTVRFIFDANNFRYTIEWVYIFYDTHIRVFPPKLIEGCSADEAYHTMKDFLVCNSYAAKNGFKSTNKSIQFVDSWNKFINTLSFKLFLDMDAAYNKAVKENQW